MPLPQRFSLLVLGQGSTGLEVVSWAVDHLGDRVTSVTVYGGAQSASTERTRELEGRACALRMAPRTSRAHTISAWRARASRSSPSSSATPLPRAARSWVSLSSHGACRPSAGAPSPARTARPPSPASLTSSCAPRASRASRWATAATPRSTRSIGAPRASGSSRSSPATRSRRLPSCTRASPSC